MAHESRIRETKYIWRNGELVPWAQATTHVMTHALHYGTAVFEGVRAYDTKPKGVAIFRNRDHVSRLLYSAKCYGFKIAFSAEAIETACRELVGANELRQCYIRPLAFLGYGETGLAAMHVPTELIIAAYPWGALLGADGQKNGVDVCVSSWRRLAPGTIPAGVKAAGNYLSSRLISIEAKQRGFAEGIGLAHDGNVSEGAGENLFLVRQGRLITPPQSSAILAGITRDTVMTLARDMGIEVVEQAFPREAMYAADEIFMCGTAAEITPVRSVDRIDIGDGKRPVTDKIQRAFFGLFNGETEDKWNWLDPVG
jgi:branched-chain amino acid aminotransferase